MNESRVLIISDEPIFSFGLRVQFHNWGFAGVEIATNCQLALQSIQKQQPCLIIIDEKRLQMQACNNLALMAGIYATILLRVNPEEITSKQNHIKPMAGIWEINKSYSYMGKPCRIKELKAAVESLLGIFELGYENYPYREA